ncbi:IPT/TIG domain-containing protein [Nocardia sp. 004]|uniref:IPT/TIG domain-containing protein n=1 Tax=Nocardia sp. 004 TaxID=3385978 RepID=UPI0039A3F78F
MAPVLTSLTPSFGPPAGGNTVEIVGSGFAGVGPLSVMFGTTATTFTIVSDTRSTPSPHQAPAPSTSPPSCTA